MVIAPVFKNESPATGLYGLVVCGGKSSRMGTDKSMLDYHGKPQCYHVYEMLSVVCEKTFISCNEAQANKIKEEYQTLIDLPCYRNTGPVAGLLTAFNHYPNNNFLIIGCDYPFLDKNDLLNFSSLCKGQNSAAFYNEKNDLYEPLLAYYHHRSVKELQEMFAAGQYSLQHFLKKVDAAKFYPVNENISRGINTKEAFEEAIELIHSSK